jgi:membrane protease YdiL (CAAX protease family)
VTPELPPAEARATGPLRWLRRITIDQWRAIDDDTPPPTRGFDWTVVIILVTVCVSLTLQEYYGNRDTYSRLFPYKPGDKYHELGSFGWWTAWRVFGYVVLPLIVLSCLKGERIRDYYVTPKDFWKHLPLYGLLFGLILIPVIVASTTESFRHTYPFYKQAHRSTYDLVSWELMYAIQFLSLEFFFRGFILHGLRRRMGSMAIAVMIVPYCMIHYGKPLPETLGAIGAGLILGTLAMRTRSIWGGVVIHVAVAWTMDLFALRACETGKPCGL